MLARITFTTGDITYARIRDHNFDIGFSKVWSLKQMVCVSLNADQDMVPLSVENRTSKGYCWPPQSMEATHHWVISATTHSHTKILNLPH